MAKQKMLDSLLEMDSRICGLHLGGCCERIAKRSDASIDHIIPEAFFKALGTDVNGYDFRLPWNLQPMHKKCNVKRGGYLQEYPRFRCSCHYLQVIGRDLYVCALYGDGKYYAFKMLPSVTFDPSLPDQQGVVGPFTVIPAKTKLPGGKDGVGYRQGIAGVLFPQIPEPQIDELNRQERGPRPSPVVVSENCRPPHRLVGKKRSKDTD